MSQNLPTRSFRDFLLRHPNHLFLAAANNRNVIITQRFHAAPVQANRDFSWQTQVPEVSRSADPQTSNNLQKSHFSVRSNAVIPPELASTARSQIILWRGKITTILTRPPLSSDLIKLIRLPLKDVWNKSSSAFSLQRTWTYNTTGSINGYVDRFLIYTSSPRHTETAIDVGQRIFQNPEVCGQAFPFLLSPSVLFQLFFFVFALAPTFGQ